MRNKKFFKHRDRILTSFTKLQAACDEQRMSDKQVHLFEEITRHIASYHQIQFQGNYEGVKSEVEQSENISEPEQIEATLKHEYIAADGASGDQE